MKRSNNTMPDAPGTETEALLRSARNLWCGAYQGLLSTHSAAHPGYPFGSVVPYCLDREGLPLLLLSHLAQHSKNLAVDSRCGLLLSESGAGDVQQQVRLSVVADCESLDGRPAAAERYFRRFPHTRPYFEQLNFRFFRLRPRALHLNAGFASARWLGPERAMSANPFDPETENRLISEIATHQPELRRLFADASEKDAIAVAGIDAHGMDLRQGERLRRIAFPRQLDAAAEVGGLIRVLVAGPER